MQQLDKRYYEEVEHQQQYTSDHKQKKDSTHQQITDNYVRGRTSKHRTSTFLPT